MKAAKEVPLRHLAECLDGRRIPLNQAERHDIPGNVPYWGSGGVVGTVGKHLFDEPLVLLGEDGAPFYDRDRDVAFKVSGKTWVNNHIHVLRPYSAVDQTYLTYALNDVDYSLYISGSTRDKLTQEDMRRILVPMWSLERQRSIAHALDRETAQIDDLIGKQERLIELLAEKRQAIITHAVTKGLDPTVPTKSSGIPWLSDVPAAWTIFPFRLAVDYQEGPGIMASDFMDDGVPLLRISGVKGSYASISGCKYLDPSKVESRWRHFRLRSGDILISASASTGTVSEVDEETAGSVAYTGIIRLRPKEKTTKEFLKLLVVSGPFLTQIDLLKTGSTMQHYGPSHLDQMRFSFPPLTEQRKIVNHVNEACGKIDVLVGKVQASIGLLQERRTALISAAVTGKISVLPDGSET